MTFTYKEQLDIIKDYRIKSGETIRSDCPFCGGHNSFKIEKIDGVIYWGCFRNSCGITGLLNEGRNLDEIKDKLFNQNISNKIRNNDIPADLFPIGNHPIVIDYLKSVNSLLSYEEGLVDIKYCPSENRVMFGVSYNNINNKNNIIGYSGRSLDKFTLPRWKKFGDTDHVFTCGKGQIGVVVEDCASACNVGQVIKGVDSIGNTININDYTGIALLGTNLTLQHKLDLRKYSKIIIALDNDASKKAIKLSRKLSNASVRFINKDLKYCSLDEIKEILE